MVQLGKKGIDYFSHDTNLSNDQGVELLEAEFGLKGYAIYLKILENIYADKGYYMEWGKDVKLLFAKKVGESGRLVGEVLGGLLRRGLLSQSVFEEFDVLTSRSIQRRYLHSTKRRKKVPLDARFLLVRPDVYNSKENVNIINGNANNRKQSIEKDNKEEINKPNKARVRGCPVPEPLRIDGFKERYEAYCRYMKQTHHISASIGSVQSHFRKLIELKQSGYDPLKVIDQTMAAGNKSFYPLNDKNFNHQNHDTDGRIDVQKISNDIDDILDGNRPGDKATGSGGGQDGPASD